MFSYDAPPTTDLTLDFEVRLKITVSWRINQGFKSWGNNFVFITLALKEGQRSGTQTLWKSVSNNWWGKTSFSATKTSTHNSKLDIQLKFDLEDTQTKWALGWQRWERPFSPPLLPHAFSNGSGLPDFPGASFSCGLFLSRRELCTFYLHALVLLCVNP